MKEIQKIENKLLDRVEYSCEIISKGATKSRKEIIDEIVKKYKVDKKLVVLNEIKTHFKSEIIHISFYVYSNEKTMEDLTLKHIKARNDKAKEEPKKEEVKEEEVKVEEPNKPEEKTENIESSEEEVKEE